eukprot:g29351.t1
MRPSADVPVLYGTLLVLEVLRLPTETTLTPPIAAVAYCLRDERVRSLLADVGKGETYEDCSRCLVEQDSDLGEDIQVKAVSSELELFGAVAELFHAVDPAVVLGYDIVKGSVGLLLARAQTLGLRGFAETLARACGGLKPTGVSEVPVLASQAIPGSPADDRGGPRKLYPPEQVSGGLELPGRLLLNVWRVLRGEAKLQTSSLQTAVHVLLGETLPLVPHAKMAERWRGTPESKARARRHKAMSLVLAVERLVAGLTACCAARPRIAEDARSQELLPKPGSADGSSRRRKILLVAVPAASDLLATALAAIGIMYIPASVWQMLRGATLFFTGIFSVAFLKRKLQGFHWVGLTLCMVGVVTVGYASVAGDTDSSSKDAAANASAVLFGVTLTLLGQVVQAAQVILEECCQGRLRPPGCWAWMC